MELPNIFCWTRIGAESGESLETIFKRKEWERKLNYGHFVWGIGNSVSLQTVELVKTNQSPVVIFSRMRTIAQDIDAKASRILLWTAFRTGSTTYDLPPNVFVTSRALTQSGDVKERHYGLFCHSNGPVTRRGEELDSSHLVNLGTSNPVGFSQVTAVVKREKKVAASSGESRRYSVDGVATLVYPYCALLEHPVELTNNELQIMTRAAKGKSLLGWRRAIHHVLKEARQRRNTAQNLPIQNQLF